MKILVLPTDAIVKDLEHLDHKQIKFVGKKFDKATHSYLNSGEPVELDVSKSRYRTYYLKHLQARDLLPANDFTKKLIGHI
jgi:hypothetical protein